ncbi:MAG: dihydrolipoyl dehydrogenase family protein [Mangrovicoccus sp.]
MADLSCDICVIGGGSGGLSVAAGASQMGADVILLEGHKMGGDCLNYGCVPSKALLAAAKAAYQKGQGADLGVASVSPQVDFAAAKDHVQNVIASIAPHDSVERFEGLGVRVTRGYGRFLSPKSVAVGQDVITARRFVIATGSSPFVPPIKGLGDIPFLTNETLFDLRRQPEHLIIIGGGPIGLEMAQAHRRLGCDVTVVEGARALSRDDPDFAALLVAQLQSEGVTVIEGDPVAEVTGQAGEISVITKSGQEISGSHLLVAVGRKANLDKLDLHKGGIDYSPQAIEVDAALRSVSNRRVYAIGDVAGHGQYTHLAGYHAGVVVRSALLGLPAKACHDHIPAVTYTSPELAQIGLTEAQARKEYGTKLTVVEADFADNDRARAEAIAQGRVKAMIVKGKPVGVTIIGPQAGELIGAWSLIMANGLKISALSNSVLPYPTLAEVNKRVAGAYFSPKLFDNPLVKKIVRTVQRWLP